MYMEMKSLSVCAKSRNDDVGTQRKYNVRWRSSQWVHAGSCVRAIAGCVNDREVVMY